MFPIYQFASYQYALGEVTVDTEERRIKVLKLRLLYSPEMSAV